MISVALLVLGKNISNAAAAQARSIAVLPFRDLPDEMAHVSELAKALNVAYRLDGSVRKDGDRLRVATRLVSVNNGYVVWPETYDRPWNDLLKVQDDIASEVAKLCSTRWNVEGPI